MDRVLRDKWAILAFVLPALLVFSAVVILPIVFSGYYSLLEWNGAGQGKFIGFQNYVEMFTNPSTYFVKGIVNSAILAALSIFVQVPLALGLALLISRGIRLEGLFRNVYFIPVIISTTVIGQLWMKIYHPNNGMLNVLLTNFGLEAWKRNWLADPTISLGAVFFVLIWQYIGYHMLLLYSSIKAVPTSLYEAAEIDGCGAWKKFLNVTLPGIRGTVLFVLIELTIGGFNVFTSIKMITGGKPAHQTDTLLTWMYYKAFSTGKFGYAAALSFVMALTLGLLAIVQFRAMKSRDE